MTLDEHIGKIYNARHTKHEPGARDDFINLLRRHDELVKDAKKRLAELSGIPMQRCIVSYAQAQILRDSLKAIGAL